MSKAPDSQYFEDQINKVIAEIDRHKSSDLEAVSEALDKLSVFLTSYQSIQSRSLKLTQELKNTQELEVKLANKCHEWKSLGYDETNKSHYTEILKNLKRVFADVVSDHEEKLKFSSEISGRIKAADKTTLKDKVEAFNSWVSDPKVRRGFVLDQLTVDDVNKYKTIEALQDIVAIVKDVNLIPHYKGDIKEALTSLVEAGSDRRDLFENAVTLFHDVEEDRAKRKEFVAKAVGSFLSGVRERRSPERKEGPLDDDLLNRMKNGIIAIASPSFGKGDEAAKTAFDNKVASIIRRATREEGRAMSWGQFRQSFKERIMDSLSATFSWSQKSKTQKIIDANPQIIEEVKKHLPAKAAKYPRFHGAQKKPEQSRAR